MAAEASGKSSKQVPDNHWVVEICDLFAKNVQEMSEISGRVAVYRRVPKSWKSAKPEVFTPQFVGLGLFHGSRRELLRDKLKLVAAQSILHSFLPEADGMEVLLQHLNQIAVDFNVQSFYEADVIKEYGGRHRALRSLTVDGLFLLGVLQSRRSIYSVFLRHREPVVVNADGVGVALTADGIKRDIFMLENQIPIPFLTKLKEVFNHRAVPVPIHEQSGDENLGLALREFCQDSCPLVEFEKLLKRPEDYRHLLELTYHLMVPEGKEQYRISARQLNKSLRRLVDLESKTFREVLQLQLLKVIGVHDHKTFSRVPPGMNSHRRNERNCFSNVIIFLFRCIFRSVLAVFLFVVFIVVLIGEPFLWDLRYLFGKLPPEVFHDDDEVRNSATMPVERVNERLLHAMPSVPAAELHHSGGINFCPAKGGILSIEFNEENCKFYLPRIKLDVNSEVIIKNLLAYEQLTSTKSESRDFVFSNYMELMKYLINTPEDVKLLARQGIIETAQSPELTTQIFSWENKSIRPALSLELADEVVKAVCKMNENGRHKKVVTKSCICSGKLLIFIVVITLLVLIGMQLYCSVFGCSRGSKYGNYGSSNNLFITSSI